MAIYVTGYDLNKAGKSYDSLITEIKTLSNGYWHHLDSTWLIGHRGDECAVRDALTPHLDGDDEPLVALLAKGAWGVVRY